MYASELLPFTICVPRQNISYSDGQKQNEKMPESYKQYLLISMHVSFDNCTFCLQSYTANCAT